MGFTEKSFYSFVDEDPYAENIMKKYIGIDIPAYGCNLGCTYCYLEDKTIGRGSFPPLKSSVDYIRYRLNKESIGRSALIGLCGSGETMLADQFEELCIALLKEGHYLIIVTNGLCTDKIEKLIKNAGEYARHLIFKMSFHYLELKNKNLLRKYANSIQIIDGSEASYTVELMPHDEIINEIPKIMEYSMEVFGALPQLTIGRNEHDERKLLTNLPIDKYVEVWGVFDSEMFNLKIKYYMMHGMNCNAGRDSFFIDLSTGNIRRCLFAENKGDFYDDCLSLDFDRVGDTCPLNYCFNCHAYVTIGLLPDFESPTLAQIRDRKKIDGKHWLKDDARRFMNSRIQEQ